MSVDQVNDTLIKALQIKLFVILIYAQDGSEEHLLSILQEGLKEYDTKSTGNKMSEVAGHMVMRV